LRSEVIGEKQNWNNEAQAERPRYSHEALQGGRMKEIDIKIIDHQNLCVKCGRPYCREHFITEDVREGME